MFTCALSSALVCILMQPSQKLEPPKGNAPIFAVGKASQDGKSIAVTQTAGRLQTYTVSIPVTRTVKDDDGNEKTITEMRMQTRTRRVGGAAHVRTETYNVQVPVTIQRTDKDGKRRTETVMRTEQRTRTIPVPAGDGGPKLFKMTDCKFADLQGKVITHEEVAKRLKSRSPVLLSYKGLKLDPFYRLALNEKIVMITLPEPKPDKNAPPRAANDGWRPLEAADPFAEPARRPAPPKKK